MNIEILDDIVNELADMLGIYGACKSTNPDGCEDGNMRCCRVGFDIELKDRIYAAIENEKKLAQAGL